MTVIWSFESQGTEVLVCRVVLQLQLDSFIEPDSAHVQTVSPEPTGAEEPSVHLPQSRAGSV